MLDLVRSFPIEQLLAFTAGGLVVNLVPGQDVFFASACGVQGGPRAGALAGLGVGLGVVWHVCLAALGLSAVIAAHPEALSAIKWAGAGYLAWLAVKSWRAVPANGSARGVVAPWKAIGRGFLSNALNPKPVLFVLAFLPQFTDPARGPIWQQILFLGGIFTFTGTIVTMAYGVAAGWVGHRVVAGGRGLNRTASFVYAALAAKLVAE